MTGVQTCALPIYFSEGQKARLREFLQAMDQQDWAGTAPQKPAEEDETA